MFSTGQLIFALSFLVIFIVAMVFAYGKDKLVNRSFYRGSYKVLLFALFVFFALYGIVKLKHLLVH